MIKAFWIELKRSPARWWLPILIAMDLAMLFGRGRDWIGVWPQASAAAQVPAFYLAPAVAAIAAWAAGRTHRTGVNEQFMATIRPRWQRDLLTFATVLTYALLAYVTGIAAAALVSVRDAGPGFLWPSYLLLGLCLILIGAAIGFTAGRWIRSAVWPAVLAILIMLALARLQTGSDDALYVLSGRPQLEISPLALVTRFVFAATLVAAAVFAPGREEVQNPAAATKRNRWAAVTVAAVLPFIAAVWFLNASPLRTQRPVPAQPLCTSTTPRICLWPEELKYLPLATQVANNVAAFPPDTITFPDTFYERGAGPRHGGEVDLQLGQWGIATGISSAVLNRTLPPPCRPKTPQDSDRMFTAVFEIDAWVSRRAFGADRPAAVGGGPPINLDEVLAILRSTDAEQATWFHQKMTRIKETPCK